MENGFSLKMPGQVFAGKGALSNLPQVVAGAKRIAIFTDRGIRNAGLLDRPIALLNEAGLEFDIIDNLAAEPTADQAAVSVATFRAMHADRIVAIGGGSVMDVAKIASVSDTDDYDLADLLETPSIARKHTAVVMVPTTAGTGAEATPNAIVTIPEKALKIGIVNPCMIADTVILDEDMVHHLPRSIAAATGIDAMAHAIECFTSRKATPFSDLFALQAFVRIERSIERACDATMLDESAKMDMLLASFYAGVAIAAAGTTGVHALSYPLGGRYHIPHGIANAILLMPVMRFNEPVCQERFVTVYDAIRPQGGLHTIPEKSAWVLGRMAEIVQNVGIVPSLKPYGIQASDLDDLVAAGMQVTRLLVNNLREITAEDARKMYQEVL